MGRARLPVPLYPTVLGLALVTDVFIASGVSPFSALRVLLVTIVVPLTLTVGGRVLLRDRDRGALAAALGVLALMTGIDLRVTAVLLAAVGALLGERYLLPNRLQTIRWPQITVIMSRLTAILALAVAIHALQAGTPGVVARAITTETALRPAVTASSSASDPDIYLILLDGHARADVLTSQFGVDGGAFTTALETRGFQVASHNRSNYPLTSETLSSMLNMTHLPDEPRMTGLLAGTDPGSKGRVLREVINDSLVFRELRARGYLIEAISSGWEEVSMREADLFVDTGQINEFEVNVLRRTTFAPIMDLVRSDLVSDQHRSRIQGVISSTRDLIKRPADRPRFLFAHIPSPHPPWVFTADGSPRTSAPLRSVYSDTPVSTGLTEAELVTAYAGQVVDVDRRVLSLLDELAVVEASNARPAITVVFSDHGSWIGAERDDHGSRFKTLLAIRSTGPGVEIADDLTLVNLFPSLFAQVFGVTFPRQPDTAYIFGPRDPFDLIAFDDPDAAGTE